MINEFSQNNVSPEAFHAIYEWMIFSGADSNKILKRDNVLDLFCAAQFLCIKGMLLTIKLLLVREYTLVNLTSSGTNMGPV